MNFRESEVVELKEIDTEDIKKELIRRMIKETDGDRFEEMRSVEQELTFNATEQEFALRGIGFGKVKRRHWAS